MAAQQNAVFCVVFGSKEHIVDLGAVLPNPLRNAFPIVDSDKDVVKATALVNRGKVTKCVATEEHVLFGVGADRVNFVVQ